MQVKAALEENNLGMMTRNRFVTEIDLIVRVPTDDHHIGLQIVYDVSVSRI